MTTNQDANSAHPAEICATAAETIYTVTTCSNDYDDFRAYTDGASGIGEMAQRAYATAEDEDRWVVAIVETDHLAGILAASA